MTYGFLKQRDCLHPFSFHAITGVEDVENVTVDLFQREFPLASRLVRRFFHDPSPSGFD